MTYSPQNSLAFEVQENVTFVKDFDRFILQFTDLYQKLAKASNSKDIGIYDQMEILCGQTLFGANPQTKRGVYRKCFAFGGIAPGGVLNIGHNIVGITVFTRLYGTIITNVPDDRPLPYIDAVAVTNQVSLLRNGANIVVTNGATAPAIVSGIIVAEILKS